MRPRRVRRAMVRALYHHPYSLRNGRREEIAVPSISCSSEPPLIHSAVSKKQTWKSDRAEFSLGNYPEYYCRRGINSRVDPRLEHLSVLWFKDKICLDIGCNSGLLTIAMARRFGPRFITGIDIDRNLIEEARKNLQLVASSERRGFPLSCYAAEKPSFPCNISFHEEDFLESSLVTQSFHTITCFSVTKWIHLNRGDAGLKSFFRRVFESLTAGGVFILESQPWRSYKRHKMDSEITRENYLHIKLKPDQFPDFLVAEIGFSSWKAVYTPEKVKGFDRPILVFHRE